MDYLQMIIYLLAAVVPSLSVIVGQIAFRKRHALYFKMIIGGVGCIGLAQWFDFFYYISTKEFPTGFNIGTFGVFGAFAFFLFANYGQIDSLVDDGLLNFTKYRYIAGIAPILIWIIYFIIAYKLESYEMKITFAIICAGISFADYFHFKHIIMPDVDFGITKCLRLFNIFAIIYSLLYMAQVLLIFIDAYVAFYAVLVGMIIISGLFVPFAIRGVKKWTI